MDPMIGLRSANDLNLRLPYLRQITGYMGRQLPKEKHADQSLTDHSYCKPWNSHPFASRTKPARLLFYTYPTRPNLSADVNSSDFIDVEGSLPQSCPPPYDMIKAKSQMNEWESHLSNISVDDRQDDWEEKINRSGWTAIQNRVFTKVCKILHSDCLAKLSYVGSPNEPVMRRIYIDKGSKRLRQVLASVHWDFTLVQWLHSNLLEHLPISYLAAYLDMLHSLKTKVPALINKIITASSVSRPTVTGPETSAIWNRRPWDPILPSLAYNKLKKLPGSPFILVVPFAPSQGICNQTKRMKFWLTQLANMGNVIPITMYAPGGGRSPYVTLCMDHIIGATRTKVNELTEKFPKRPIVLVGWGVGAVIACYVGLQEQISAVVCLGFQMTGFKGTRGDVDDPLLESQVSTLFVVGQNSPTCKVDDIEEFREKMKTETSLVIVGGADEWLRINHYKKKEEGITQTVVDRCLLDEISNFLGTTLTSILFQTADNYNNSRYGYNQPVVRENKRRKRKLDTILEFDDDGGVEAPVSKWKASSLAKNEQPKSSIYSNITIPFTDKPPFLPEVGVKITDHSHNPPMKTGKINPLTGKRCYVRRSRVHIPVVTESTSSDSSSTSGMSSAKSSADVEEVIMTTPNPSLSVTPSKNNNGSSLSFNIGFLSSLGQTRRNLKSTVKTNPTNIVLKSPEAKTLSAPATDFSPLSSTSNGSIIQLYKTITNPNLKSNPLSIYSVPTRSAFSIPRSSVKSTVGLTSMNYTTLPKSKTISPIQLTPTENQLASIVGETSQSLEPEQVQAIQKLQFHDFPLTTASLTKTTSGLSITQAKILSSYNLDLKKLQQFTTESALSNSNVYIATTPTALSKQMPPDKGATLITSLPQNNPITSYTISSMMAATPDKKINSPRLREPIKRSPVSVIVLTPSKARCTDDVETEELTTDVKAQSSTESMPVVENTETSICDSELKIATLAEDSSIQIEPNMQNVQELDVENTVVDDNDSLAAHNLSDSSEINIDDNNTSKDSSFNEDVGSPELLTITPEGTQKGKFKAPTFPTIASTRTRRIRTPKYMYYDV